MRVVLISDTHGKHNNIKIPEGDILIHCGDFTACRSAEELPAFNNWMGKQPCLRKIFCPGNHDAVYDKNRLLAKEMSTDFEIFIHEETTIGNIKTFISPVQPVFGFWSFNYDDKKRFHAWQQIPEDTEILITHCPPYGILDEIRHVHFWNGEETTIVENVGDKILADRIKQLPKLRYHFFGHIHTGTLKNPKIEIISSTTYVNCSVLNEEYDIHYTPTILDI